MKQKYSTRQAAKKLGRSLVTIQRHIRAGTMPVPPVVVMVDGGTARMWTTRDIEKARKALAEIKPGRKKKDQ